MLPATSMRRTYTRRCGVAARGSMLRAILRSRVVIEIAADFAIRTLKPGGHFVSKNFQGGDAGGVLARLRAEFETVKYVKPESSRKDSAEVFLVAMNRR